MFKKFFGELMLILIAIIFGGPIWIGSKIKAGYMWFLHKLFRV